MSSGPANATGISDRSPRHVSHDLRNIAFILGAQATAMETGKEFLTPADFSELVSRLVANADVISALAVTAG